MNALVIVGAGGFGREVFEIVDAMRAAGTAAWQIKGFVDDSPSSKSVELLGRLGSPLLGSVDQLLDVEERIGVVLAVADPRARASLASRLDGTAVTYPVLVHPDATVGGDVELGAGTVVCAGSRLSTHIVVGEHVHIDHNCTVGHDSHLHDYVRLNPQACISGSVTLRRGVLIGANATVLQGLQIGENATVGAAACVVRPVPEATVVKGVPAR